MGTFLDRVVFTASSGTTGSFIQGSSVIGYQLMAGAAAVSGQTYSYAAQSTDLTQWEYGHGIWTSSNATLTRNPLGGSGGSTSPVNFTNPPQVMITLLQEDLAASALTYATSNLSWWVAPIGNDANVGSSLAPFLTIQHGVNVAAQYDYQRLYFPTVKLAWGSTTVPNTYAVSAPIWLPAIKNAKGGGGYFAGGVIAGNPSAPTSIVIDGSTLAANGWGVLFGTAPGASWQVDGFRANCSAAVFRPSEGGSIGCQNNIYCDDTSTTTGHLYWADPQEGGIFASNNITVTFQTSTIGGAVQVQNGARAFILGVNIVLSSGTNCTNGLMFITDDAYCNMAGSNFSGPDINPNGPSVSGGGSFVTALSYLSFDAGFNVPDTLGGDGSGFLNGFPVVNYAGYTPPAGGYMVQKIGGQPPGAGVQLVVNDLSTTSGQGPLVFLGSQEKVVWHSNLGGL